MTNGLSRLLGSGGEAPTCRVISDEISVHWWRNDDSGLCLCGSTTDRRVSDPRSEPMPAGDPDCDHQWSDRGTPDDEWRECFLCGRQEDR